MEEEIKNLEICSYRYLQQVAKGMGLPSNVKKVYLIKMINTKKYGSQQEVDQLVQQVRQERQRLSTQIRRKASNNRRRKTLQQSAETSSPSNSLSPCITTTPKHIRHVVIRYSTERHSPKKYPQTISSRRYPLSRSDRVLRSFNKNKKPYLLNNTLFNLINGSDTEDASETVNLLNVEKTRRFPNNSDDWNTENQLVPATRNVHTSPPPRARVQRRISGVYPLHAEDVPNVVVRRPDGSIARLRAFIQNPLAQRNYNYDRLAYTSHSLLRIVARELTDTATTTPQMKQKSICESSNISEMTSNLSCISSNITEINSNMRFRSSNMNEVTPNISYSSSNMSEMTPNLNYNEMTSNLSFISANNTEMNSNLSFSSSSITEMTPNISDSLSNMSKMTPNLNNRSSNMSEMTPNLSATSLAATQNLSFRSTKKTSELGHNLCYRAFNTTEVTPSINYKMPTNTMPEEVNHIYRGNYLENYLEYYHKKIRAAERNESGLPKINEVFSKFSDVYCGDMNQPLYSEPEIVPNTSYFPDATQFQGSISLETLYNFKTMQPILPICTTSNTRTIYTVPVITSAVRSLKSSNTVLQNIGISSAPPRDNQPYFVNEANLPCDHNFSRNFRGDDGNFHDTTEDFSCSSSSIEGLPSQEQDIGANVTIPEMLEDAFEVISQDGDYMERIGMDIRVQCILCNWAGPKTILESHIRNEHAEEVQCSSNEWVETFSLGGLCSRLSWFRRVLYLRGEIYVLSAKYQVPEIFMASLTTLSPYNDPPKTGSLTIHNKLTGEPFTWEGEVTELDTDSDVVTHGLSLPLSSIGLPNSADLQLVNREQTDLDNIHFNLFVKIFD